MSVPGAINEPDRVPSINRLNALWPRYAAILVIALALLHNLTRTWLKWGDLLIDSFRDLDIARQVSDGRQLYGQVRYCYGPLAVWINAAAFRLFGVHTQVALACGFVCTALTCVVIYRLARQFITRLGAVSVTLAFLYICAFGHLTPNGAFNYMLPYTPAATYGMLTALTSVYFLVRYVQKSKSRDLYCSAAALFLTALTKIELTVALGATHAVVQLLLIWSGHTAWKPRAAVYVVALGFAAAVYAVLYIRIGPVLFSDNLLALFNPTFKKFSFETMGLADWRASLWSMLFSARALMVVFAAAMAAIVVERRLARSQRSTMAAATAQQQYGMFFGIACMALAGVVFARLPVESAFRILPVLAAFQLLVLIRNGVRQSWRSDDIAEMALWMFCLICLGRILLRTVAYHYGFYLLAPGLLCLGVFWFSYLPRKLPAQGWVPRLCGVGVFAGLIFAHVQISDTVYALRTQPIRTPTAELFAIRSLNGIPVGGCWAETIRLLSKLPPKSRVLAIPQGMGLLFSAGLENRYGSGEFTEPEVTGHYGDAELLERLKANPPDLIVHTPNPREVFGVFGDDYAQETWTWITANYEPLPYSIGPDDYILLFKKRNSPDPFLNSE